MRRFLFVATIALGLAVGATVQSATQPTGKLNVPAGMSLALKVAGKAEVVPTGRDVPLPAGNYEPASLTCGGPDKAKVVWSIKVAEPNFGKIKQIAVAEGATTTLEAGPPFTLKTIVYAAKTDTTGGKVVPMTLRIFGKAGELYDYNTLKKGIASAPQVGVQILDEQGKVLTTGTLPFG
jgi:hypothetical protein